MLMVLSLKWNKVTSAFREAITGGQTYNSTFLRRDLAMRCHCKSWPLLCKIFGRPHLWTVVVHDFVERLKAILIHSDLETYFMKSQKGGEKSSF